MSEVQKERDEAQHAHVDKAPPDACWLCWKSLGTTESCPMCTLKRQESAPEEKVG